MESSLRRFASKLELTDGCWLWRGAVGTRGYGVIRHERRLWRPHRLIYTVFFGPVPDGLELDHVCREKLCCNPAHLEAVTHSENMRRWWAARRST